MSSKHISSMYVSLGGSVSGFSKSMGASIAPVTALGSAVTSTGSKLAGMFSSGLKMAGIGGLIASAIGALKGAASGITLAAELEQVGVAFETMLGSAAASTALMDELTKFSAATPFEFPEIAASAKKLLAFGVGAADMTNKLTMLGDIAAGIGAPLEDIAAIYGKIKSRGQLTGETLNQMAERGIPIYKALASSLGVAESQIAGMVTAGKIGFAQVDAALGGLTGQGGQFSGMMAKQSQTLSGLWSTLTDTIGLGMAGMVTKIVEAFSLRDALKGLTSGLSRVADFFNTAIGAIAPMVRGFATGIYNFVSPIFTSIGRVFAANWQGMLQSTVAYGGAIVGFAQSIWNGLTSLWTWGAQMITGSTAGAGISVAGIFQGMIDVTNWLRDGLTVAFQSMTYAVTHWRETLDLLMTNAALSIVRFGNQVEYFFVDVIPAVIKWFADDWQNILSDLFNWTATVFTNLADNVVKVMTSIPDLIKGNVSFADLWTPLTDGFERASKELVIPDRQIGELEQSLSDEFDQLSNSFGDGLGKAIAEQEQQAADAANRIKNSVAGAFAPEVLAPPGDAKDKMAQAITPESIEVDVTPKLSEAIRVGSAEAQALRFAPPSVMPNRGMRQAGNDAVQKQQLVTQNRMAAGIEKIADNATTIVEMNIA